MKVLLADDHMVVRRGLRQIIEDAFEGAEFHEVGTAQDALEHIWNSSWDVLILDQSMPGRSGLDVLKDIRKEQPDLPVLVLSMYPEEELATRALRAGASGYLSKEFAPEELVGALKKVMSGGTYVSPELAEKLASGLRPGSSGDVPHEQLSDREFEVLCMIGKGKTVSEIAAELSLSVKTISTYRVRLLEKMGMKTNAELTKYALQHDLAR